MIYSILHLQCASLDATHLELRRICTVHYIEVEVKKKKKDQGASLLDRKG